MAGRHAFRLWCARFCFPGVSGAEIGRRRGCGGSPGLRRGGLGGPARRRTAGGLRERAPCAGGSPGEGEAPGPADVRRADGADEAPGGHARRRLRSSGDRARRPAGARDHLLGAPAGEHLAAGRSVERLPVRRSRGRHDPAGARRRRLLLQAELPRRPQGDEARAPSLGNGHGHFSTRGRYAAATVRGTIWEMADYANGSLCADKVGVVSVLDLVKSSTVLLRAGQNYFAAGG